MPKVESVNDFEICRVKKEKCKSTGLTGQPEFEVIGGGGRAVPWEVTFVQFKDGDGQCIFIIFVHTR